MARVSNKSKLATRQDVNQPSLIDDSQLPVCAPVLEAVKARRFEHTGVALLEDEARALRLVECLIARWGVKKISREMQISPHTVRAARRLLVLQGKLAPYKQRVVEMMEDVIEAGLANYRDAVEAGIVSPSALPVGIGIISDKRALALGEPTSISGRGEAAPETPTVEALNAYFEKMPVVDCESSVLRQMPNDLPLSAAKDTERIPATIPTTPPPPTKPTAIPDQNPTDRDGAGGG